MPEEEPPPEESLSQASLRILFVCPHASAEGLVAATYFRAAAVRAGLEVAVDVVGTEPDEVNDPRVQAALRRQGFTIGWQPRLVTEVDARAANLIVSIGCEHRDIPTDKTIIEWPVPTVADDFDRCINAIHDRSEALAAELAASRDVADGG